MASQAEGALPPIVDMDTWAAARDELMAREKAHTKATDALSAARRALPMVEIDATVKVVGPDGPVPFRELFQGRDELLMYQHMWWDATPIQGQCEGCTMTVFHLKDPAYLNARGVSFAVVTVGSWDEVAPFVEFMGYTQPWYSVRDLPAPIGGDMGNLVSFLRDGDRVFLTYSTSARGTEPFLSSLALLDMTPYGRAESWQDTPVGGDGHVHPSVDHDAGWFWRSDVDGNPTWGENSRPVPQWSRPGATPEETLGRES